MIEPARGRPVRPGGAVDPDATGIILAGGAGRRYGGDKLGAIVDGRPLVAGAMAGLGALCPTLVVAVGAAGRMPDPGPMAVPWRFVRDPIPDGGPLVGLEAALEAVDTRWSLVVGGDMPRPQAPVLRALLSAARDGGADAAVLLEGDERRPLPVALRVERARVVARRSLRDGRRSLRALLDELATVELAEAIWRRLDPAGLTLLDIDVPADVERLPPT